MSYKTLILPSFNFNEEIIYGKVVNNHHAWIYLNKRNNIKLIKMLKDNVHKKTELYRHKFKGYFLPINRTVAETKELFDYLAPRYNIICKENKLLGEFILELMKKRNQKPKDKILDIMAGTGLPSSVLYKVGYKDQTLLDISSKMLLVAKKNMPSIRTKICSFEQFQSSIKYDAIISIFGLHYLKDYNVINKLKHSINKEGNIYIIEPAKIHYLCGVETKKQGTLLWFNGERKVKLYYYIL